MDEIFLTGDHGYLGSTVLDVLRSAGRTPLTTTTRLQQLRRGDIRAGVIIHCAGALRHRAERHQEDNVGATAALLGALPECSRIIFISSRSVYPRIAEASPTETTPPAPFDSYGWSKLEAENLVRTLGTRALVLRSTTLFGHPSRDACFLDHAVTAALSGTPVRVARPDRSIDHVSVGRLATVVTHLATRKHDHWGGVYNVASTPRTVDRCVEALSAALRAAGFPPPPVQYYDDPNPPATCIDGTVLGGLVPIPDTGDAEVFGSMIRTRRYRHDRVQSRPR